MHIILQKIKNIYLYSSVPIRRFFIFQKNLSRHALKNTAVFVLVILVGFSNVPADFLIQAIQLYQQAHSAISPLWNAEHDPNVADNFKSLYDLAANIKLPYAEAANNRIFIITTASTTWTVPADWNNSSNTIELIGGAGGGGVEGAASRGGAGGGGGAYVKITNWASSTVGTAVKIQVGKGGTSQATGTLTYFGWTGSGSTSTCSGATMSSCAAGGGAGNTTTAGPGGASSTSVGATRSAGGAGGAGSSTSGTGGAG